MCCKLMAKGQQKTACQDLTGQRNTCFIERDGELSRWNYGVNWV